MRYLFIGFVFVSLLATPAMATFYDGFAYPDGGLNGQGTWSGNASAAQVAVASEKVVVTAGSGLTWAYTPVSANYEADNTITFAIKLQMVSGDTPDYTNICDIIIRPTTGLQQAGWRIQGTQVRGRQGDFTSMSGVQGNKTDWVPLVGNSAAGTWDLFEVVNDLTALRTYYYVTPAGGSRTQIGDAGNAGLAGSTGIDSVWMKHVGIGGADQINVDDVTVTPEPATLILLALGLMPVLRRRRRA